MIKDIAVSRLISLLIFICFMNCGAGSNDIKDTKESIMAFETKDVAYPVRFANFQRNSNVPAKTKSKWTAIWSKNYSEINEDLLVIPYSVLVRENLIGVRSNSELFVYDIDGVFKYRIPVSGSAETIFGKSALAYLNPYQQLIYQDYEYNKIGEASVIPDLDELAYELLMQPTLEDILAVVQFTGGPKGPKRKPEKYYIYKFSCKERQEKWYFEYDGVANQALLTNDEKTIVLIKLNEVYLISTGDGAIIRSFKMDIDTPVLASLDKSNNIIILSEKVTDGRTERFLKAYNPDGKELWSFAVSEPNQEQPPACGSDGQVYIVDGLLLNCITNGKLDWTALLKPAEKNWLTITADNDAVVINGNWLVIFDSKGEKVYEQLITKTDDTFSAPPAVDFEGRIFIAGEKALYCFE